MTLKPMIYVAGPIMTGGDVLGNIRRGIEVCEQFRKEGLIPFCPHTSGFWDFLTQVSWEDWLAYDEQIIMRCDAVFRMKGDSRGADRETAFANAHNIPVFNNDKDLYSWAALWIHEHAVKDVSFVRRVLND